MTSTTKFAEECKAVVCTKTEQSNIEDDCKDNKDSVYVEAEVLIEQPINTEFDSENENPLIKQELQEETDSDDVPLKQRRKKMRQEKSTGNVKTDPLKKTKSQKSPNKNKTNKEHVKNPAIKSEIKEGSVKQESTVFETSDVADDYNTDTDSENQDETKNFERGKKKRKNPDEKTCQEHDKIIAENFQIFCSICQISLENFIALRKHFREEHKKRGFVVCCRKKIFTRPVLVDHIHFHMDPNYFKCKFCDRVYSERSTLESHMKFHEDSQNGRTHSCETCGKTFVGAAQLEHHKLTHAPDYEKKFSCADCGKL